MRKHTLEYDDVLNQQREVIYTYRDEILEGRDMSDAAREEIVNLIERLVEEYTAGDFVEDWDVEGLIRRIEEIFTPERRDPRGRSAPGRSRGAARRAQEEALAQYDRREQEFGEELMRDLERFLLLQIIDQRWREHLYDMDYLREGIHLRGFAQIEPLVAYKNEAFELFRDLMNSVWGDFARMIFHVEVTVEPGTACRAAPADAAAEPRPRARRPAADASPTRAVGGAPQGALAMRRRGRRRGRGRGGRRRGAGCMPHVEQRRVDHSEQIGRNDPCWCGSGKKYKKCHGA